MKIKKGETNVSPLVLNSFEFLKPKTHKTSTK